MLRVSPPTEEVNEKEGWPASISGRLPKMNPVPSRRLDSPASLSWQSGERSATMRTLWAILLALSVPLIVPASPRAGEPKQPPKEAVEKGQSALKKHLEKVKGSDGQVVRIDAAPLRQLFPKDVFFAVRYRVYPVAQQIPEGMKPSNVFVFSRGKLTHLGNDFKLDAFFKERLPAVKTDAAAKKAAQAWLWLSQEFRQDGFYKFAVADDAAKVEREAGKRTVTAKAAVTAGGEGEVEVILLFDAEGQLAAASFQHRLRPEPRPKG